MSRNPLNSQNPLATRLDQKTPNPLVRRASGLMALEQRFMFDGAAIDTAVEVSKPVVDTLLHFVAADTAMPTAVITARAEAEKLVDDFLAQPDAKEQLFALFNGGQSDPSAQWQAAVDQLLGNWQTSGDTVRVELRTSAELQGAKGAFSATGTTGQFTIYLNSDWLAGNPSAGIGAADSASVTSVLVEELGHYLDARLNGSVDTAGDEGHHFSNVLLNGFAPYAVDPSATGGDHGVLQIDDQTIDAEFASFTFINAYEMVYDNWNTVAGTSGTENTTERWASKEQNLHYFDATHSLGRVSINDGSNGQNFSGNDVSATSIVVSGTTYWGWISRPIKANGVVKGFYFWTDNQFTNLADAQTDGNQDPDGNADNRGFLLVVDQDWFSQQIAAPVLTNRTFTSAMDGTKSLITIASVGSSSDRVDSALNGLIVPNSAPTPGNDSLTVIEDSGTSTVNAANGLLANDTDVNNNSLTVTSFSVGGISTTVNTTTGGTYTITNVGDITIFKDGSYSFTPAANYYGAVPPITYTVSDGTASATATATAVLSISVTPVNDAPIASNDIVTTSENTPKVLSLADFGTYSDPENNPLAKIQITDLATNGTLQYWNGSTWASVTLNQEFTTAQILQGQVRFMPDANETGANYATIQFKVSDGQTYSANPYTLTVVVTAGNQAPVAVADTKSVTEAGFNVAAAVAAGNVLTDPTVDSDPESQTLTVSAVTYDGFTKAVSGATSIKGQYGTLTINPNGSYSYALDNTLAAIDAMNSGDTKTEAFSYTVTDGTNSSTTTLTLTINGTNDAPVALNDFSTLKETTLNGSNYGTVGGNALSNDSDVDSTLSIAGSYGSGIGSAQGSSTYTFTVSNSIGSGNYVFYDDDGAASGTTVVAANTAATGEAVKLTVDYNGSVYDMLVDVTSTSGTTFKIVVGGSPVSVALNDNKQGFVFGLNSGAVGFSAAADGSGNYKVSLVTGQSNPSSATVTLSSITAGAIAAGMTVTDGSVTRTVQTVTKDSSGNVTSMVLDSAVTWSSASLTFTSTASPLVLAGQYGTISIDRTTGAYTYTLTSNALNDGQVFDERFSYRATDGICTDDAIITVRIAGASAPYLQNDTLLVFEDSGAHVTFNGSVGVTASDTLSTNDAGGTSITLGDVTNFTVAGSATVHSAGSTATISGVGTLSITAAGTIAFDPVDGYLGPVPTVTYTRTGSDGQPYKATLTLTIQAVDNPSVLVADTQTVNEDTTATGNVLSNDSDVDSTLSVASYTVAGMAGPFSVGVASTITSGGVTVGTLTLSANGNYSFVPAANWSGSVPQITYTTNTGSSSTLSLTVSPVNDAPTLDLDGNNSSTAIGSDFKQSYTNAETGVSIGDTDVTIFDIDDTNIENAQIVLMNAQAGDALNFDAAALLSTYGITATSSTVGGVITVTLSGSTTLANYQAAIQAITFSSSGSSTADRAMSVKVNDGTADSNTAYTTIAVSPDNRLVTVTGTIVNEASPYVVFEVDGAAGQQVRLELGVTGTGAAHATQGVDFLPNLQYFNGTGWVDYTGGLVPIWGDGTTTNVNGKMLVRTAVLQDIAFETTNAAYETLKLTAYNANNTASDGISQIRDDAQGSIYLAGNNTLTPDTAGTGFPAYLDDDRPLSVNNISVNEASPYVVFTVTGQAGQVVRLATNNLTAAIGTDTGPELEYNTGSGWQAYTANADVTLVGTTLLVRTTLTQDAVFEGQEAFALNVTKQSSGTSVYGTANIYDDGTGSVFLASNSTGTPDTSGTGYPAALDDDRTLAIDSPTVNEASNIVVFTLTGNSGQTTSLALINESSGGTVTGKANINTSQTLKIWDGLAWVNYDASALPTFDASGKIYVSVNIQAEQDAPYEGSETFKLNASLTGTSAVVSGSATIKDDGTGVTYPGTFTVGVLTTTSTGLDDDRPSNITVTAYGPVNEASTYAMFKVVGTTGQTLDLSNSNGTATLAANAVIEFSYDGTTWSTYSAAGTVLKPLVPANGTVYVRTTITSEVDDIYEGSETFSLVATDASTPSIPGTAQTSIVDDGTGKKYGPDMPGGTPAEATTSLDDDRPALTVAGVDDVSEGSYAIFTVTLDKALEAATTISLTLADGTAVSTDYTGATMNVVTSLSTAMASGTTVNNAGNYTLAAGVQTFYVRVQTTADSPKVLEGAENFKLTAAFTDATLKFVDRVGTVTTQRTGASADDTSTILDNGTGKVYDGLGGDTGTPDDDSASTPDNERPQPVTPVVPVKPQLVTEPPALQAPPEPARLSPPPFESAIAAQPTVVPVVMAAPTIGDILTSNSGFRVVVNESAPAGLTLFKGVTDQFVDGTGSSKISLPADAFIHSKQDAVIKLDAKMADDSKLPEWVRFDPATGSFEVQAPADFKGKLEVKVTARDEDGREATSIFRIFVGDEPATTKPQSRLGLTEKIRLASMRALPMADIIQMDKLAKPREVVQRETAQRAARG